VFIRIFLVVLKAVAFFPVAALFLAHPVTAQVSCTARIVPLDAAGLDRDALRIAELQGFASELQSAAFRPSNYAARAGACLTHAPAFVPNTYDPNKAFGWAPLTVTLDYSSTYAHDRNDGITWSGKGLTITSSGGVRARKANFTMAVVPVATFAMNADFPTAPSSNPATYGFPGIVGLDQPQRFGSDAFHRIDAGESFLRFDLGPFGVGISNEAMWWGPQRFFPLLMSNTAGGFKHVFAGTNRPIDVGIGRLDFEFSGGQLRGSAEDTVNSRAPHVFSGITAALQPHGLEHLSIGVARVYHGAIPAGGYSLLEYLYSPYAALSVNENDNQLLSAFARWVMPDDGFELYGEWARDDHWENLVDFLKEIDHSQAYGIGFSKLVQKPEALLRISGELVHLEAALPFRQRGRVFFYSNSELPQGHTSAGQLLGSWTGTGSTAQIVTADRIKTTTQSSVFLQRVRYNADTYYERFATGYGSRGHDLELTLGLRHARTRAGLHIIASTELSRRWNRSFISLPAGRTSSEWNAFVRLGLNWQPAF
jgi:hypothetical protein